LESFSWIMRTGAPGGWWAVWGRPSVALAPLVGVGGSPWRGWSGQGSGCQLPNISRPTANALRNTFQPRPNTLQIRGGAAALSRALSFPELSLGPSFAAQGVSPPSWDSPASPSAVAPSTSA